MRSAAHAVTAGLCLWCSFNSFNGQSSNPGYLWLMMSFVYWHFARTDK